MKQFIRLFQKVGGLEVLKQYAKAHVLLFALFQTLCQGFSRKSLEIVRLSVSNRILNKLKKKYKNEAAQFAESWNPQAVSQKQSKKIWIFWMQGMEEAPKIVQKCYQSMKEHLSDREIILLTEKNYRDYVEFPQTIQRKIDSGVITRTHMSDLLRLELLIRYGGTWVDATVFCSGGEIPEYMLESKLFFFQLLKPGRDGQASVLSSWFMTACTNHPVLLLTRKLLYQYWEKNHSMVDYFLLHDFFQIALETFWEEWDRVVPRDSAAPHILLLRLFEAYDEAMWTSIQAQTPFHKLSYKYPEEEFLKKDTYYDIILSCGTFAVS